MARKCLIAVLMPFYAKEIEFEVVKECLDRLRSHILGEYEFDIPMAIWKVNIDHLNHEVPHNVWLESVHQQDGFDIPPPTITHMHIQNSLLYWRTYKNWRECGACKYRKLCEQSKGGD